MEFKLKIKNLGRNKICKEVSFIAFCPEEIETYMYKEFSKYLMSRDISWNDGTIFTGFHTVGEYELLEWNGEIEDFVKTREVN